MSIELTRASREITRNDQSSSNEKCIHWWNMSTWSKHDVRKHFQHKVVWYDALVNCMRSLHSTWENWDFIEINFGFSGALLPLSRGLGSSERQWTIRVITNSYNGKGKWINSGHYSSVSANSHKNIKIEINGDKNGGVSTNGEISAHSLETKTLDLTKDASKLSILIDIFYQ